MSQLRFGGAAHPLHFVRHDKKSPHIFLPALPYLCPKLNAMLPWMRLFGVLILLMFVGTAKAQGFGPSTLQKSIFSLTEYHSEAEYDKANGIQHTTTRTLSRKCILNQQVYGWHPAWSGTAYQRYDFALRFPRWNCEYHALSGG